MVKHFDEHDSGFPLSFCLFSLNISGKNDLAVMYLIKCLLYPSQGESYFKMMIPYLKWALKECLAMVSHLLSKFTPPSSKKTKLYFFSL